MYFDPVSGWLVALIFDSAITLNEKITSRPERNYNEKEIRSKNKVLNEDIRRLKKQYALSFPEQRIKDIKGYIEVVKSSSEIKFGYSDVIIDYDNQEYMILLLENCVALYRGYAKENINDMNLFEEYSIKANNYQKGIDKIKQYRNHQNRNTAKDYNVNEKNSNESNGCLILGLLGIGLIAIIVIMLHGI